MIKIDKVSKNYGKLVAVDNLSLTINDGEIFGLLGPNGAGKSTTLKMITGLTDISQGEIFINDISISKFPVTAKKEFGYVMDSPDSFLRLKGIEFLTYIGKIFKVDAETLKNRINEYSKRLEIYDVLNNLIDSYSHGMRQKIMIVSALIHDPQTWILDEPLTGLDPQSQHIVKELMKEHAQKGKSVLFSTHVLETAERLCDRIGIINKGNLLFCGTMKELQSHSDKKSLEDIFLEMTNNE